MGDIRVQTLRPLRDKMTITVGGSQAKQGTTLTTLQKFIKHTLKYFHFFSQKFQISFQAQ